MSRLIPVLAVILASAIGPATRPANAQGYAYFPPVRAYEVQFLRRPFRLPVEALLEAKTPLQLAERSARAIPTFAAAPVVESLTNPFADIASAAPGDALSEIGSDADPFANDDLTADSENSSNNDPFAAGDAVDVAESDPFSDSASDAPASDDADPFDDPFADF